MTLTAFETEVLRITAAVQAMTIVPDRVRRRLAAFLIIRAAERLI